MLSPISLQTFKLNDKGFSIKIEDDKICFTKDGESKDVYFNCLYNKAEIDNLIAGGGTDPDYLRNICLTAINIVLQGLNSYNALSFSEADGKLSIIKKDVQHASNAILELFHWTDSNMNEICNAFGYIKQCHCMDKGGFHDTVMEKLKDLDGDIAQMCVQDLQLLRQTTALSNTLYQHNMFLTIPSVFDICNIFNEARKGFTDYLYSFWAPSNETPENEENDSQIIDPSKEIINLDIPLIDDPQNEHSMKRNQYTER